MSNVILGARLYEKTETGEYPKYNLEQMQLYVTGDCPPYDGIQLCCNVKAYDLFGKYQNELTPEQRKEVDEAMKAHYGFVNVAMEDLVDYTKFKQVDDDFGGRTWVEV